MDKKQNKILENILDKFDLPHKNITFVQHRNLKEFKYFQIEKINPTHIIQLYGVLKNNNKKKDNSKYIINVGEIIIGSVSLYCNLNILYQYSDIVLITLSMYIINILLFSMFGKISLKRLVLYDYWNRRFFGRWKNCIDG